MADNTVLNAGSGGDTVASDDIGGIKYQRVKPTIGADGTATDAVPVSNGMDVTGAAVQAVGIVAQFDDTAVGTVTENQFAPVRMSTRRALLVEGVASGTVIPVSDGSGSLTVDNGGTFVVQENGAALTALQLLDDAVKTDDAAFTPGTDKVLMVGATLDDTTPDTVNEGDAGALRMTADRALHSSIRDSAGNNRGANVTSANQLEVSVTASLPAGTAAIGKLAANSGVDIGDVDVTSLPALAAGTNNIGDVDVLTIAAGDNNIGNVDIVTMPAITGTGTFVVQVNGDALTALQVIDNPVLVDDAAFTPGTSSVQMVGFEYDDTTPDSVNEGDAGAARMSANRNVYVQVRDAAGNERGLNVDASGQVAVTSNPGTAANWGVYVEDAGETAGGNLAMSGTVRRDTAASSAGTTGDNATLNTDAVGRLWVSGAVVEDAAHTTGDQLVAVATRRIDTAATSAGTSADYATLDSSAEGAVWATLTPTTTSGLSTMNASSSDGATALTNSAQAIKASAGNLYGYYIYNPNATAQYVQFYNTASGSVTVGTTSPLFMLTIPATSGANLALPYPIAFGTAMSWAATSTAGGNGAPTTAMDAVCWYK